MSYIATSTGKHIDFVNITPDQICIEDIARGLSNEYRFAGQLESFYSVAQHSVYVSQIVPPEYALEALLHDAEAILPDYKVVEKRIEAVICEKFGLPQAYHQFMARFEMLISGKQQKTISYIKPERDSDGYWVPPGIPRLESNQEIEQWCDENNLEYLAVFCRDDIDNFHPVWFSYFEEGDTNVSAWEPTKPDGDGWFVVWIAGNEDCPICMWVSPKNL